MPELPEIETIRRALEPRVVGQVIEAAKVKRADVIRGQSHKAALLVGCRILHLARRGKQLAILGESLPGKEVDARVRRVVGGGVGVVGVGVVCVHLGMSGSLRFYAAGEAGTPAALGDKHAHVRWRVGGGELVFRDPRRFGGVWTYENEAALDRERWGKLGEDALSITPGRLGSRLAGTRRAVKAALLDQAVVAGLGNIYVDEALYGAGIHPLTAGCALDSAATRRLVREMRRVLGRAIEAGGSTLRDYVSGDGQAGRFQLSHRVYGRATERCVRCQRVLERIVVAGRGTVFCPQCQRR